jgi:predicted regulator of Ras-like GTPase activity (Roadblock/LC7/MglB family)
MEKLLRQLLNIDLIAAILLIGKDGLPVASMVDDARTEAHAAHAAASFETLTRYARALSFGTLRQVFFTTDTTVVLITEAADLLLVVEARTGVNLGRLRLETQRVARALAAQQQQRGA